MFPWTEESCDVSFRKLAPMYGKLYILSDPEVLE
jgi:hypothetical protein